MTRDEYLNELARTGQLRRPEAGRPAGILLVNHGGLSHTLDFQFQPDGALWPGLPDVLAEFREAGWDDFDIAAWFLSPQGSSDGATPALILPTDPQRVAAAAHSTIVAS